MELHGLLQWDGSLGRDSGAIPIAKTILTIASGKWFTCKIYVTRFHSSNLIYLSENLIKAQADMMVKKGYLSAGYEYIIVDDCWLDHKRDDGGMLQPDPERFPSGIKSLADHVCH